MADDDAERRRDVPRRDPRSAGQDNEESGSTAGRTHDQVLDATLDDDVARKAKLNRDRSSLR